jgi:hypothetical protein
VSKTLLVASRRCAFFRQRAIIAQDFYSALFVQTMPVLKSQGAFELATIPGERAFPDRKLPPGSQ